MKYTQEQMNEACNIRDIQIIKLSTLNYELLGACKDAVHNLEKCNDQSLAIYLLKHVIAKVEGV
jgi:hypothetical protein